VTVHGAKLKKLRAAKTEADPFVGLPEPAAFPALDRPWNILVTGVGGTGVVTIGALIGMAAHLEGKGVSVLDQTGLAQKGGAVNSHIRLAHDPEAIHAVRIAAGEANALIGCDLVVSASADVVDRMRPGLTRAVVNGHESMTGEFTRQPDLQFPGADLVHLLEHAIGRDALAVLDAQRLATALMGDSIATNPFMLGFAWQRGLVPLARASLERAIELNEVAVAQNKRAFQFGRLAAHDLRAVEKIARPADEEKPAPQTLPELVERRVADLTAYQDEAYARRYAELVRLVAEAEAARAPGRAGLAAAVARYAYKLMAIKDEYEVARLYADGSFRRALAAQFEDWRSLEFHLAPPMAAERDPTTGHLKKRRFGPWMETAFRVLARFKRLRGGALDVFGRTPERAMERRLRDDYLALVGELCAKLTPANHALAIEIASVPEHIRGYGHVKERHVAEAKAREAELLKRFRAPSPTPLAVAAE